MGDRIRRMDAKRIEKLLAKHGFQLISQKGSHRKWRNVERNLQVVVPFHKGRDLPLGTLRNILVNAGITESEWKG